MFTLSKYTHRNSIIHNCNPAIKLMILLIMIFLLFLRISLFIHVSLFGLTVLFAWLSKSMKPLINKLIFLHLALFTFFFIITWIFNKNPGFWHSTNVSNNYLEMFSSPANNDAKMQSGWLLGGKIVNKTDNNIAEGSIACINAVAGETSTGCTDTTTYTANNSLNSYKTNGFSVQYFQVIGANGQGTNVGVFTKWYTLTLSQIIQAFFISNKLIIVVILSTLLSITTKTSDLSYALEDLLSPLKLLKIPTREIALMISIALRFAPSLSLESRRIIKAQASRGIDFQNGRLDDKVTSMLALFIPLFVISFMKAGELSSAMKARGYKTEEYRTTHRFNKLEIIDSVICFFMISVLSALFCIYFRGGYSQIFGQLDYLLLIAK